MLRVNIKKTKMIINIKNTGKVAEGYKSIIC